MNWYVQDGIMIPNFNETEKRSKIVFSSIQSIREKQELRTNTGYYHNCKNMTIPIRNRYKEINALSASKILCV